MIEIILTIRKYSAYFISVRTILNNILEKSCFMPKKIMLQKSALNLSKNEQKK